MRRWYHRWLVLAIGVIVVGALVPWASAATPPIANSAGNNTALPATSSAMTLSGRGNFSNLKVTLNQTQDLFNQAVSVTWTGGAPTLKNGAAVLGNFFQIFQCWGNGDGTNTDDPGPSPADCEFGGFESNPGSSPLAGILASADGFTRTISQQGWIGYNPSQGYNDTADGLIWEPFDAVDGTVIKQQANFNNRFSGGNYWQNPYFDIDTSNEDVLAYTAPDGTGSELFQVDTGLEAPGLGCGQSVQPLPGGSTQVPKCWLVVVPRGTGSQENVPAIPGDVSDQFPVQTSPLSPAAWANRISFPLSFVPVGASCPLGADERRIVGSELAVPAVTSWQPTLCAAPGSPPYNYSSISDDQARQQLVSGEVGAPGMAVLSRPIDSSTIDPKNPVVYAPLTLSGITIGFNIERLPSPAIVTSGSDPAEVALATERVQHLYLTPRLVAKLLTESYSYYFFPLVVNLASATPGFEWMTGNPTDIVSDPDFLQFNPEFKELKPGAVGATALVVEQPNSDAAYVLWRWVLSDPEASAWLNGAPDPWGMKVNPYYSTKPQINPSGAFGVPIPETYPASDPYCYQSTTPLVGSTLVPRPLCVLDAHPYANTMATAASQTRQANSGSDTLLNTNPPVTPETSYVKSGPNLPGNRFVMSVTETASAARYGLQEASLSRDGDDTAGRAFVAPDTPGLLAGEAAMMQSADPNVLEANPASKATGAYPLPMLTYAAVAPRGLSSGERNDYAAFISYGVGSGQASGLAFGDLPPGYAPLPSALVKQATTAAALIKSGDPAPAGGGANGAPGGGSSSSTGVSGNHSSNSSGNGAGGGSLDAGGSQNATAANAPGATGGEGNTGGQAQPVAKRTKTPSLAVGVIRYTLPIALIVAVAALGGALSLRQRTAKLHLFSRLRNGPEASG